MLSFNSTKIHYKCIYVLCKVLLIFIKISLQLGCVRTIQSKYYQYEISWQPVQWEWHSSMQKDTHHEAFLAAPLQSVWLLIYKFWWTDYSKMSAILKLQLLAVSKRPNTFHCASNFPRFTKRLKTLIPCNTIKPRSSGSLPAWRKWTAYDAFFWLPTRENTSCSLSFLSAPSSCLDLLLLCLFFTLPITVPFQFSHFFLLFPGLISTS